MGTKTEIKRTGWREVWGTFLLAASVLVLLSLISYQPGDISMLQSPPQAPPANLVGPMGAWFTFFTFMGLGVIGYVLPVVMGAMGLILVFSKETRIRAKLGWLLVLIVGLTCTIEMQPELWAGVMSRLNIDGPGGLVGTLFARGIIIRLLGHVGATILAIGCLVASLIFLFEIRPAHIFGEILRLSTALTDRAGEAMSAYRNRQQQLLKEAKDISRQRKKLEKSVRHQKEKSKPVSTSTEPVYARTVEDMQPRSKEEPLSSPKKGLGEPEEAGRSSPMSDGTGGSHAAFPGTSTREDEAASSARLEVLGLQDYQLPPIDLLHEAPAEAREDPPSDLKSSAKVLEDTLRDFGIECKVTHVECGPVVTRYEVLPAAGVRVERISGLSNNIALALKAVSVRVQAPIPGKGVVGIEVPNSTSTAVYLRDLLESSNWRDGEHALPLALGKDVGGRVLVADLAAMPHMLIAGATGAGKTVCMNSLLAGLLMSRTPDQMRLMLVDPKIVEFGPYNGLPHLVVPVITDPKKVGLGLRWAKDEMEKRYKMFAKAGVRNIKDFNSRPREEQADLFDDTGQSPPPENRLPETIPYIVIVVDELADLMLAAQAEIENLIAKLAQLSRAVGIHMIIATQRPSVNVITGTIKANFPARLAFQVAQKVDSRTILDTVGADKLLGKGDMLFLPPGSSKLTRAQGSFTSDVEIRSVVQFVMNQGGPQFVAEIQEKLEGNVVDVPGVAHEDELMDSAIEIIRQTRRASTSSLQRRLRIGYTRAARLMDILEEKGIIGPPQGSDPREILIDLDNEIPQNNSLE